MNNDEMAWRKRPSCPGAWVCIGEGRLAGHDTVMDLTQDDIDTGAPFYSSAVFGPIPSQPDTVE
jgi:hypothetical protein